MELILWWGKFNIVRSKYCDEDMWGCMKAGLRDCPWRRAEPPAWTHSTNLSLCPWSQSRTTVRTIISQFILWCPVSLDNKPLHQRCVLKVKHPCRKRKLNYFRVQIPATSSFEAGSEAWGKPGLPSPNHPCWMFCAHQPSPFFSTLSDRHRKRCYQYVQSNGGGLGEDWGVVVCWDWFLFSAPLINEE